MAMHCGLETEETPAAPLLPVAVEKSDISGSMAEMDDCHAVSTLQDLGISQGVPLGQPLLYAQLWAHSVGIPLMRRTHRLQQQLVPLLLQAAQLAAAPARLQSCPQPPQRPQATL